MSVEVQREAIWGLTPLFLSKRWYDFNLKEMSSRQIGRVRDLFPVAASKALSVRVIVGLGRQKLPSNGLMSRVLSAVVRSLDDHPNLRSTTH